MASGGSGKKVFMQTRKIQSFHADRPLALDQLANEWLDGLSQEAEIIGLSKYCSHDGRKHYCSIVYQVPKTQTETSSPSKK